MSYALLDSGDGLKYEFLGGKRLARPAVAAIWKPQLSWDPELIFSREKGWNRKISPWEVEVEGVKLKLMQTDFGHLGLFPEHSQFWPGIRAAQAKQVLNLFAYSGAATLAAAQSGAKVCHVDAAKGMVSWARENAALNGLEKAPIRWIIDDAIKFLKREVKRRAKYDGIILDPPSFGRGSQGQVFKIERDLPELILLCKELLHKPKFFLLTLHTPGFTPFMLEQLLKDYFSGGRIETGEMILPSKEGRSLPAGIFGRWSHA